MYEASMVATGRSGETYGTPKSQIAEVEAPAFNEVLERAHLQRKIADSVLESLSSLRSRLFGPRPELGVSRGDSPEVAGAVDAVREVQSSLTDRLHMIDALAREINSRL